jgi:hypothetical protein
MPKWFGPKTIGWGIAPRSWQGWLLTMLLIGMLALLQRGFHPASFGWPPWYRGIAMGGVLAIFFGVVYLTYDREL